MAMQPLPRTAFVVALLGAAGLLVQVPAATAAPAPPHVSGTRTVPVYDYATAIRESVWVTTTLDNDGDGAPDKIAVDLIRPREPAAAGIDIPVIMDASPYYTTLGRGNESERKVYAADGTVTRFPLFYDNYFVPRGYAFAAVDLAGTARSTGCGDIGGREEIVGAKAVIDWLNGRARGEYADGTTAVADWSTGKVGMIGKSWDGTIANGVAATGVDGLATIVPISAISSWYDYYRDEGVIYFPNGPHRLQQRVTGRPLPVCQPVRDALLAGSDDATGNYNPFWRERDYVPDVRNVKASVFLVHGVNDLNVDTNTFATWWDALARRGVPRKIWLGQEGHVDPFDFRRSVWVPTLQRWFDFWLQGLRNGVMREPMATIERTPDQFVDEPTWPALGTVHVPVSLGAGDGATGTLGLRPTRPGTVVSLTDDPALSESAAVSDPSTAVAGRRVFLSAPLPHDLRISGTPVVSLRIRSDRPTTEVTARLVDYGTAERINYLAQGEGIRTLTTESCFGATSPTDDPCYRDTEKNLITADLAVLHRGWLDAAHDDSLISPTPLTPGEWTTVSWRPHAHDVVLPAGRVLGLVITLSDNGFTSPSATGATVDIDLSRSRLSLPVSLWPGATALPEIDVAPRIAATAPAEPASTAPEDAWLDFR
ncbi:MAG TPA: Xaa-Pro dipeptidyl-peptidase [Actinophytocola sp.]|uniref:Xaa-Pro dipeptidyl-peptidase n=1 Tax=Actinophytocola sp. TaxID=1872138 RepID=UPI002DDCDCE9|nr:Xaa-Pro dipeptidyl-peptidase [Actinophytocola sp.]HEV2782899.1 Xaa-Pro dipeptidyl-peptidase [Actinophytocola sp.]